MGSAFWMWLYAFISSGCLVVTFLVEGAHDESAVVWASCCAFQAAFGMLYVLFLLDEIEELSEECGKLSAKVQELRKGSRRDATPEPGPVTEEEECKQ